MRRLSVLNFWAFEKSRLVLFQEVAVVEVHLSQTSQNEGK